MVSPTCYTSSFEVGDQTDRGGNRNDAKTVSIVALGCFHPATKVQNACLHFFLGSDEDKDDSDTEEEGPDLDKLAHQRKINKKTKGTDTQLRRAKKKAKKVRIPLVSGRLSLI